MVGRFAEIAVELKPKMIIMENVPDLLAKKHWHHYQAFKDIVEAAGYHIAVKILGMADYGTPQSRFRKVLIAAKDFIPTLPESTSINKQITYGEYIFGREKLSCALSKKSRLLSIMHF